MAELLFTLSDSQQDALAMLAGGPTTIPLGKLGGQIMASLHSMRPRGLVRSLGARRFEITSLGRRVHEAFAKMNAQESASS